MLTDLHWAIGFQNPFSIGNKSLHDNPPARPTLNIILEKLTPDEATILVDITMYQDFKESRGAFDGVFDTARADLLPHESWDAFGNGTVV